MASETPTDRGTLWRGLKAAREAGIDMTVMDEKPFVEWTVPELQVLYENVYGTPEQYDGSGYSEAEASQAVAASYASQPAPAPAPLPTHPALRRESAAPAATVTDELPLKLRHEDWVKYNPKELAEALGVPFSDVGDERAGIRQNTHDGRTDPLRVDSLGRVWYVDEILKSAVPKPRMVRKTKSYSSNVEVVKTKRPDGGLDETFEIAGQERHEIEIRTSMPTSQVGLYRDPRFPFRIHQYNGRRGFDHEEVRDFYGGLQLIPTRIQEGTIYIDLVLCFDMNIVRDAMESELRDRQLGLGRSSFNG